MKKLLLSFVLLISLVVPAFGQGTTGTIDDGVPFYIEFDHTAKYATKLLKNGVVIKTYTLAEVLDVRANSTGLPFTYKILVVGQPKIKPLVFTAVSVDTDGVESDISPPLDLRVKPRAPQNLQAP